jgi:8-oxo-dGTP pyrophosphatase MutT (NUDIX family)
VAAVRELNEEVGIRLEKDQLTFVGEYAGEFKSATDIGTFFEIAMAELPQVQADNREVVWAQFVPLDQVYNLNLSPTVKTWLKHRSY